MLQLSLQPQQVWQLQCAETGHRGLQEWASPQASRVRGVLSHDRSLAVLGLFATVATVVLVYRLSDLSAYSLRKNRVKCGAATASVDRSLVVVAFARIPGGQDLMIAATATRCYDSVFLRSGSAGALRSRSLMRRTELVGWARDRRRGRRVGFHVFGLLDTSVNL